MFVIKALFSETSGQYIEAGLPDITGEISSPGIGNNSYPNHISGYGAFYNKESTTTMKGVTAASSANTIVGFNASLSNNIYGKSNTVTPLTITAIFIIKD